MINYDDVTKENVKENNQNLPEIPYHPYTILIIRGSGSGKRNALLNLTKHRNDGDYSIIDKIYLYVKNPNEAKYQYLIKNLGKKGLKF